jgi:CO dehydrogenase/acetyl-CoA synthase beta subunit
MPLKDPIERKEYDKKYYKKNKDKRNQTSKLWAQNNRESYNKNSRINHITKIEKK